ncbi:MAG: tetratricopeptide repeat protein [Gemmataceae bacterium]|nr:tetratricopeptide repeat protein [Gemmataceae bacterium]
MICRRGRRETEKHRKPVRFKMEDSDPDYVLFREGRAAFDSGDYELALTLFRRSLESTVHFKTLELIGEALCQLGRFREAIVPLAAAAGLNRGSRAPCLLAEAFAAIEDWRSAKDAAEESLRRTPSYNRAKDVLAVAEKQLTIG